MRIAKSHQFIASSLAITAILAGASAAHAQAVDQAGNPAPAATEEEPVTGDIVVTAQRRSQSLLAVPLAVSAIGGESLQKQGILQPNALASTVPNLQVNDSTGGAEPNFTLRGVGLGVTVRRAPLAEAAWCVRTSYRSSNRTYLGQS